MPPIERSLVCVVCILLLLSFSNVSADEKLSAKHPTADAVFGEVNGVVITVQEFQTAFQAGMRKRFYHGKIPEGALAEFREEVSQALVDRVLLVEEAGRLGLAADMKKLNAQLSEYETRYANSSFWKKNKETMLPGLRRALEDEGLIDAIQKQVKQVKLPSLMQAEVFYKNKPELFTTPERMRVSLILLKVSPASPANIWEAAKIEAEAVLKRLRGGADFSELAMIHSGDASAAKGGDMGFIHSGMLAEPAQKALDILEVGQVSEAVMSLRGIAIFRLEEKQEASLNAFSQVSERAQKLLQRQNSNDAWDEKLMHLRAVANVKINREMLTQNNL